MNIEEQQQKLLEMAKAHLGKPYKYGSGPEGAPDVFDCSSFTQYLYKQIGIELPRSSILQATQGVRLAPMVKMEVGDLLFFRGTKGHYDDDLFPDDEIRQYIGHVAMYSGNGNVIHANGRTKSVAEMSLLEIKEPIVRIQRILR